MDETPMVTITCEGCKGVIAVADTAEEAAEVAEYEKEADPHRGDTDSGDWECKKCKDERYAEGMAEARIYEREQESRRMTQADEDAREAYLERADLAYDSARDRGEI